MDLSFTELPTDLEQFSSAFCKIYATKYVVSGNKGYLFSCGRTRKYWLDFCFLSNTKQTYTCDWMMLKLEKYLPEGDKSDSIQYCCPCNILFLTCEYEVHPKCISAVKDKVRIKGKDN